MQSRAHEKRFAVRPFLPPGNWTVWRQDYNANRFTVRACLTYAEAKAHKQFYWCEPAKT
jgi:hypothetical protein